MAFIGSTDKDSSSYGHYASDSGFDFKLADGDLVTSQLRALLIDEELLAFRVAA